MPAIVFKKLMLDGQEEFFPYGNDRFYSRVVASMVWPGERPGFITILGEEMQTLRCDQKPALHELTEFESHDLRDLLDRHLDFLADWKFNTAYAPPDISVYRFIRHFNEEQREKRMPEIRTTRPPYYDQGKISYHLNILKEQLRPASKRLHLHVTSRLPGYLNEIPANASDTLDSQHPAIASLAYGVTALVTHPFIFESQVTHMVETDYDVYK